jgi:hypothetical protein
MGGRHKSDPTGNGRVVYAAIALVAVVLVVVAALAVTTIT